MRCGSKNVNNFEVPANAVVKETIFDKRQYYISGLGETHAVIRYLDTGQLEKVPLSKLSKL